jgi:riboflavin biosynthesis pyrimidine reductase
VRRACRSRAAASDVDATPNVTNHHPIEPLEVLFEDEGLPTVLLPPLLEQLYGGALGLDDPCVYANFVSTVDGVVSVPSVPRSNAVIAMDSDGDRLVMSLLRAFADCVLVGAGTLAASPKGTWRAERVFPAAEAELGELRRARGRPATPEIAIVTGRGSIDPSHPVLATRAVVLTSDGGAERLAGRLPAQTSVVSLGSEVRLDPRLVVQTLRERGHTAILSEAGPHTFGGLLDARLVDELFLTVSPLVAGSRGGQSTFGLVESTQLLPPGARAHLRSVRRHEEHLFLRYAFDDTRAKESG